MLTDKGATIATEGLVELGELVEKTQKKTLTNNVDDLSMAFFFRVISVKAMAISNKLADMVEFEKERDEDSRW